MSRPEGTALNTIGSLFDICRRHGWTGNPWDDGGKIPEKWTDIAAYLPAAAPAQSDPVDLFTSTTDALPQLTKAMLPAAIADFAFDSAERKGVTAAMVAMPCLFAAATVISDNWKIQATLDESWLEAARLWLLGVALSGMMKSACLDDALKPIRELEERFAREHRQAVKEYENKAATSEKGAPIGEPPTRRRFLTSDATVEALAPILVANTGGIGLYHDELAQYLGGFDAYRNVAGKDRPKHLRLWNGHSEEIDRANTKASWFVPNWGASNFGYTQPESLAQQLHKLRMDSDGLVQRFMVFYGNRSGERVLRPTNAAASDRYRQAIHALAGLTAPEPRGIIHVSDEAREIVTSVIAYADRISQHPSTLPAYASHASKWCGTFVRMLLTYHAVEMVDGASPLVTLSHTTISGATARRCADLMFGFLIPHADHFYTENYGKAAEASDADHAKWIAGYILSRDPPLEFVTARDLKKFCKRLKGDNDTLDRVMTKLMESRWVDAMEIEPSGPAGGRPSKRWAVNQDVYERFADQAKIERRRRLDERTKILETTTKGE
jgi:hypothetical protein